jgi:hypothetical protein
MKITKKAGKFTPKLVRPSIGENIGWQTFCGGKYCQNIHRAVFPSSLCHGTFIPFDLKRRNARISSERRQSETDLPRIGIPFPFVGRATLRRNRNDLEMRHSRSTPDLESRMSDFFVVIVIEKVIVQIVGRLAARTRTIYPPPSG